MNRRERRRAEAQRRTYEARLHKDAEEPKTRGANPMGRSAACASGARLRRENHYVFARVMPKVSKAIQTTSGRV